MSEQGFNPYIVLVVGKSGNGKSSSLKGLDNPDRVLYLNCENGRALPFKSRFKEVTITHPEQIPQYIQKASDSDKFDTIVIDSLTYMMDMYESMVVLKATNTQKAWGDFQQFFKSIMHLVAKSNKQFIFTAHTATELTDEGEETFIRVKGALKNNGIESFFTNVIAAKKVRLNKLDNYSNALLNITDDEEELGLKYVLQTRVNKDTIGDRIKSNAFDKSETFIDNNIQLVLNRLKEYYG